VLVELRLVEQRYQAVLEVLNDGAAVLDVARRHGVARQTVHDWLRRYAKGGLAGLADKTSRPLSCPHQMGPVVEAKIIEMRRAHPGWGPRTIVFWLERAGVEALPGRTSVERCLIRHGLVTPQARKRKRSDYKRWERARAMELWQMDIVGGVRLAEGSEAKIVSGIDDHSRFVISAAVVERATARPVCDALEAAIARHGAPEAILTDNGKVFTARFGPGPGPVLFDRICRDNGIDHLLTAPRSPTTTGKIERWHKTLRTEFLNGKVFASITDAQAQLDRWVDEYNHQRPHQSIGGAPPFERFKLAPPAQSAAPAPKAPAPPPEPSGGWSFMPIDAQRTRATWRYSSPSGRPGWHRSPNRSGGACSGVTSSAGSRPSPEDVPTPRSWPPHPPSPPATRRRHPSAARAKTFLADLRASLIVRTAASASRSICGPQDHPRSCGRSGALTGARGRRRRRWSCRRWGTRGRSPRRRS
jgi:transposase InsO family protein